MSVSACHNSIINIDRYIRGVMYLQFPRILTSTCLVWGHVYYAFLKGNLFLQ